MTKTLRLTSKVINYLIEVSLIIILIVVQASSHLIILRNAWYRIIFIGRCCSMVIDLILPTAREFLASKLRIQLRTIQTHVVLVRLRCDSIILSSGVVAQS